MFSLYLRTETLDVSSINTKYEHEEDAIMSVVELLATSSIFLLNLMFQSFTENP